MFIRNQGGSMNIHEYQAKRLLAEFGVPVPDGRIAYTVEEAAAAARSLGGAAWFVKPQRIGPAESAVAYVTTPEAAASAAERLLDHASTGTRTRVTRVLVEEALPDAPALAVLFTIDGAAGRVACAVGASAGANRPGGDRSELDALSIDPATGFNPHHARNLAHRLGLGGAQAAALGRCLAALYEAVIALDATRIEIDPLLTHESRGVVAVGIAMTVDDAALFRHPEIMALREYDQEDEVEREAERHGLNYMRLEGSIGCLANGAGLAMATMDCLRLHGGAPANFLDIGGGVTHERVVAAFKLVLADPHVEGVLVNVFGGIMRCDVIAEGILAAAREVGLHVPLVVRLEGTNVDLGRKVLRDSGLPIYCADTIDEAAAQVVAAVRDAA
jgi:succinyl-CoA synthetase beta subunit